MSQFSIEFLNAKPPDRPDHLWVKLQLGPDFESWQAYIGHWSQADYESQWKNALHRLTAGYTRKEALVSYFCRDRYHFISCWAMYRVNETVIFQEHGYSKRARRLRPNHPRIVRLVDDYDPEGNASEWHVPFSDVATFAHQVNQD